MPQSELRASGTARSTHPLSTLLENKLTDYAAAACTAGVGVLALAQPAAAKIVYTPAHIRINHSAVLDLNHDGINDFSFTGFHTSHIEAGAIRQTFFNSTNAAISILGAASGNQVFGQSHYASALQAGVQIGLSGKFPGPQKIIRAHDINGSSFEDAGYGPWAGSNGIGIQGRYLGLKFTINGETHFGWARMNVKVQPQAVIQATITGYAYEDVPNMPIQAGRTKGTTEAESFMPTSPSTLGALARGARELAIWRREEPSTS